MKKFLFLLVLPLFALPIISSGAFKTQRQNTQNLKAFPVKMDSKTSIWTSLLTRAQSRLDARRLRVDFIAKDVAGKTVRANAPVVSVRGDRLLLSQNGVYFWLGERAPVSSGDLQMQYATLEIGDALPRRTESVLVSEGSIEEVAQIISAAVDQSPDPASASANARWFVSDVLVSGEIYGELHSFPKTGGVARIEQRGNKIFFQSATLYDLRFAVGTVHNGHLEMTVPKGMSIPVQEWNDKI